VREPLQILREDGDESFAHTKTADESWNKCAINLGMKENTFSMIVN
jgi:hypothetical protein